MICHSGLIRMINVCKHYVTARLTHNLRICICRGVQTPVSMLWNPLSTFHTFDLQSCLITLHAGALSASRRQVRQCHIQYSCVVESCPVVPPCTDIAWGDQEPISAPGSTRQIAVWLWKPAWKWFYFHLCIGYRCRRTRRHGNPVWYRVGEGRIKMR